MSKKHKVFISFHHANDENYKLKFEELFNDKFETLISGSIKDGDINPNDNTETIRRIIRDKYLRNTTVTIVLVGKETWKRKHVDWEIYSSLRKTKNNPRSGLLGILLPTHFDYGKKIINTYTIPPRLYDNINCGYAELIKWTKDPEFIQEKIHEALKKKGNYSIWY